MAKRGRKTTRVTSFIVERLRSIESMKNIGKDANVSSITVSRILPPLAISSKTLPKVLCIDEFKGNTGNYKYQVSI